MVVAIDGPAGSGKSTVAKKIADDLGFFYLNSGNFYRGVTLYAIENRYNLDSDEEIIRAAEACSLSIHNGELYLNDENVEPKLHTDEIDNWVAEHSAIVAVRKIVNEHIRKAVSDMDIVAEGRDMTTVVFPKAEVKFYLDASIDTRTRRRNTQGISQRSFEEIRQNLEKRDNIDKNKPFGSLKIAEDAAYLDTTDLTIEAVCEKVQEKIEQMRSK